MMHFSCDICGKDMTPDGSERYVVKVEAFAARPAGLTDDDLEADHIEEMAQLLSDQEDGEGLPEPPPVCRKLRFDLCAACFRRFDKDPLGREAAKFDFSPN